MAVWHEERRRREIVTAGGEAAAGCCLRDWAHGRVRQRAADQEESARPLNLFVRPETGDGRLSLLRLFGRLFGVFRFAMSESGHLVCQVALGRAQSGAISDVRLGADPKDLPLSTP